MDDIFVPETGAITWTLLTTAFPITGNPKRFSQLYNARNDTPSEGQQLRASTFRNKTAPRPTFNLVNTSGNQFNMNTSGIITGLTGGSFTVNFVEFLSGQPLQFHRGLTFSLASGSLPSGGSLGTSNGILSLSSSVGILAATNLSIRATNGWGKIRDIPISLTVNTPPPPVSNHWMAGTVNRLQSGCALPDGGFVCGGQYYDSDGVVAVYNASGTIFNTGWPALTGQYNSSCFIVKYNFAGDVQWVTNIEASSKEYNKHLWNVSVCPSGDGGFIIAGRFQHNAVVIRSTNGTSTTLNRVNTEDVFIVKYNTNGVMQWVNSIYTNCQSVRVTPCTTDNGFFVMVEYTSTGLTVPGGAVSAPSAGSAYLKPVIKYDSAGNPLWIVRSSVLSGLLVNDVQNASDGSIYMCGAYYTTCSPVLGNTTSSWSLSISSGNGGAWLGKFNSVGECQWLVPMTSTQTDAAFRLCITSDGNIIVHGHYYDAITFYSRPSSGTASTAADAFPTTLPALGGYYNYFLAKYTPNGYVSWVNQVRAGQGSQNGSLIPDTNGGFIFGVHNYYTEDIRPYKATTQQPDTVVSRNHNEYVAFIARYGSNGDILPNQVIKFESNNSFMYILDIIKLTNNKLVVVSDGWTQPFRVYNQSNTLELISYNERSGRIINYAFI